MLVLSRKLNEEIRIDGEIILKVVEVRGGRVRLGIEAPASVSINRAEVAERLMSQPTAPITEAV